MSIFKYGEAIEVSIPAFKKWPKIGGGHLEIHASGDNSHQWDWYEDEVIGARFSSHPLNPQFQNADIHLDDDNATLTKGLPKTIVYVFR